MPARKKKNRNPFQNRSQDELVVLIREGVKRYKSAATLGELKARIRKLALMFQYLQRATREAHPDLEKAHDVLKKAKLEGMLGVSANDALTRRVPGSLRN